MNTIKLRLKAFFKIFVSYTIEQDLRCYQLKHTPIVLRIPLTKKKQRELLRLPIQQNKIVFDNYMGRGYGGNCKYVTEELLRRRKDLDIVWTVRHAKNRKAEFPAGIRLVEYQSMEAFKEYATAAIWVCNYHLIAYFNMGLQKKEQQRYIQMWHGSLGIKKIEADCECLTGNKSWSYLAKKNSENTDIWISNSTFESNVYRRAFWSVKNILEYGHPRNDILWKGSRLESQVKLSLGIKQQEKMVLYVPTFRENGNFPEERLNVDLLNQALEERFGGNWRVVVRAHPRMTESGVSVLTEGDGAVIRADQYPDIQELLVAAQAVVTDYSSCIFDFLLTGRPGFIYAPDIEAYNHERGFYYKLEETPFTISVDNRQLGEAIRSFEEENYRHSVSAFIKAKGCVEDGQASERVVNLIEKILQEKES